VDLAAGVAAIAGQVLKDEGDPPVHCNLQPRALVVPPNLWGAARATLSALATREAPELAILTGFGIVWLAIVILWL